MMRHHYKNLEGIRNRAAFYPLIFDLGYVKKGDKECAG